MKLVCGLNQPLINSSLWINSLFYTHYSRVDKHAAGWGIADDMNSAEHPRELSRVLRERKYPFKLPVLHAFPLINKMHAGREEKQQRSFGEKGKERRWREEDRGGTGGEGLWSDAPSDD